MAYWRVLAAGAAASIVLAGSAACAADPITFRLGDTEKPEAPAVQGEIRFGEILRERSGGRLSIDITTRSNDTASYTINQVRNRSLDMARINLSVLGSYAPSAEVLSMPYLFGSRAQMRAVLAGSVGDSVMRELEMAGLVGLCFYETSPRSFYGSRPIRTASDVSGLTVSVLGSEMSSEIVRALGARPVPMSLSQVRSALSTGAATLSEGNWVTYIVPRHYEVASYYSLTEHVRTPNILVLSKLVWDKLTPSDQRLIRDAARESVAFQHERLEAFEQT
ncbi:MAG: TRAP transporter substrate-binding protein DctP, partial [Alphaproteobacteria bacterium]|nr:TRAP transporter substrate-binding protein DctP [Alphaproteobacteria bacterium]